MPWILSGLRLDFASNIFFVLFVVVFEEMRLVPNLDNSYRPMACKAREGTVSAHPL
jgi:hypothetical protein